jgi:hypothetical protein
VGSICLSELLFDDCEVVHEDIFPEKFFLKMEALGVDGFFLYVMV